MYSHEANRGLIRASWLLLLGFLSCSDAEDSVNPVACDGHCGNGARDCGETGVDCGGECVSCSDPCAGHCTNAVQDCDETGIDCGGECISCSGPCAGHCTNAVQDCSETGIDCGGECISCSDPCAGHCGNDIQDCEETGIDCGGECISCSDPCADHCTNAAQDCDETGIDCGGAACSPCLLTFDFQDVLFGPSPSLSVWLTALDQNTGDVDVNGMDSAPVVAPFTFAWGDGSTTDGYFPQSHNFTDTDQNYVIDVTAHYASGSGSAGVLARFVAPTINPMSLSPALAVTIPGVAVTLDTRLYPPPTGLSAFDDSFFVDMSREHVEYVLSVAATIQHDLANDDVFLVNGGFQQVVLRDPAADGMYSLWYTSPVAFGSGDWGFSGSLQYSSFFHEMGHNVSLNSPAPYYFGGKIDGNANAIFSETMAQIFQHATAYELLNSHGYGLSADLLFEIEQSALASMRLVRNSYDEYVAGGERFASWNDPGTPNHDETFGTFMTLAYKFFEHAENAGGGYKAPLQRMMALLQTFDADLESQYDAHNNTTQADTFRSTLMVTALSYAFDDDLRAELRTLGFPVDDTLYDTLYARL